MIHHFEWIPGFHCYLVEVLGIYCLGFVCEIISWPCCNRSYFCNQGNKWHQTVLREVYQFQQISYQAVTEYTFLHINNGQCIITTMLHTQGQSLLKITIGSSNGSALSWQQAFYPTNICYLTNLHVQYQTTEKNPFEPIPCFRFF